MKLHLLHCSGVRVKYQCTLCKEFFQTEKSLNEHYMPLYTCDVCGQIFSNENSYKHHQCPKGNKSPLVLFCSNSMPQACNVCKTFFTSEKNLLNHFTKAHTSVVSTKVCIITNPSVLTDRKVPPGVLGTAVQSAASSPNVVNQIVNGKLHVGLDGNGGSLPTVVKASPSSHMATSPDPSKPVPMYLVSATTSGKDGTKGDPANQPVSHRSPADPEVSGPAPPPMPTIMAMFENASHDLALVKRMSTGWRSKAPHPCRQCGAILRQPSFIISHRYLHRGPRSHRCHCGRAFRHRLHLLRHCVQHAETITYICVGCGETFTGAKLLAEHMRGKSRKKSCSGQKYKGKVKRKCKTPFICDCGQLFFRPSAYIWHQLRNRATLLQLKKPLK
ncbi:zinc finger protein 836 [Brachionichthys hirsutus]|uniref:zinc finger protein 836 n=1 Tax=Brachionichthys hirsutus TaxID=412623 RepID=UPI0036053EF2